MAAVEIEQLVADACEAKFAGLAIPSPQVFGERMTAAVRSVAGHEETTIDDVSVSIDSTTLVATYSFNVTTKAKVVRIGLGVEVER